MPKEKRPKDPKKSENKKKQEQQPSEEAESQESQRSGMLRVLVIEATSGEQFECEVPIETVMNEMAADFFEARGWSTSDRAVVELVDPENPDRTKRLRGEMTVEEAGLRDGDTLRIFPESVAGQVDERKRLPRLIQDLNGMTELAEWNSRVIFEAKPGHTPTLYELQLDYSGFKAVSSDGHKPVFTTNPHEVEIQLGAQYPRQAPFVRWKSEIFHPNIDPRHNTVCLGVLSERYLPGLGLARLVIMLAEIAQWRNYDITNAYNPAAAKWAADPQHRQYIKEIGGYPYQHPIEEFIKKFEKEYGGGSGARQKLAFNPRDQRGTPNEK